jgi:predicted methyltransferase
LLMNEKLVRDLIIQADFIARRFNDLDVTFIGDGDAISLSMMHLKQKGVFEHAPRRIRVLDFDERIVNSINDFAEKNELVGRVEAFQYDVCDPLPKGYQRIDDAFYTNPPWGASNDGQSVKAFVQRGIEASKPNGLGAVVIADDDTLEWTGQVLLRTQQMLIGSGYIISEMIPGLHKYHLDDAPELTSCCMLGRVVGTVVFQESEPLPHEALANFYGRNNPLTIRYVKDLSGLNRGRAHDASYQLIPMEDPK